MKTIILSFLVATMFSLHLRETFAQCSCWPKLTLQEEFQRADEVFVGKVIETTRVPYENDSVTVVKVEVIQAWKQDSERFVTIKDFPEKGFTNSHELNVEWLLYAHRIKDGNGAFVAWHCCSRTKRLSEAAEDLKQFRKMGEKPKKILETKGEAEQVNRIGCDR